MRFGLIECGSAAAIVAFALLAGGQSKAAEQGGVRTVAEELGSRTVETPADSGKDKLSDSAVRVMSTFALSILPDEVPDKKGKMVKIDKSNPNLYLIPIDDARHVIRVATRSAYAEVCNLLDLEKQNYNTLMRSEELRNVWTEEQMMFIRALHTFATSYFAGNVKITESGDDANKGAAAIYAPPDGDFPDDGVVAIGPLDDAAVVAAALDLEKVRAVRREGKVLNHLHWAEQAGAPALSATPVDLRYVSVTSVSRSSGVREI